MEFSLFPKEKGTRLKRKVIPWHLQKRYNDSVNLLPFNQSAASAFYKREINLLKRNNKHLALALQRSRYLATDKENLLIDNGKTLDIINFSRLKLKDMSISMKQASACLDEALLLLNSAITDKVTKHSPTNLNYRNDLKSKLQELNIEPIEEISEPQMDNSNKSDVSCVHKGKISRVEGCISPPNKKCKVGKKGEKTKKNCKDVAKGVAKSGSKRARKSVSDIVPNAISKDAYLENSKKYGSASNIKSQRKKSLLNSPNIESPLKLLTKSSNLSLQTKMKQKCQDKRCKPMNVMLTDIAESFVTLRAENGHSPETKHSTNTPNFGCFTQNYAVDNILIKNCISSDSTSNQKRSTLNSCLSQSVSAINDAEMPNCSQNSSDSIFQDLISSERVEKLLPMPLERNDFVHSQTSAQTEEDDLLDKEECSEKDKTPYKSQNSISSKRIQFFFDEDSIEMVDGEAAALKNKNRKTTNKCKARKTVSNVKSTSSKSTTSRSNYTLPDNVSKLGKNSFLVTAEVHSPPNGIHPQEMKNKMCVTKDMEPRVLLTDIFKSNRGLLSEMVGIGLSENRCLQKTITNFTDAPMDCLAVNNLNSIYDDPESNTENRCLPEDRKIKEEKGKRCRTKIVSYKEPSLHVKMRRLF